jgi:hypothetical protein
VTGQRLFGLLLVIVGVIGLLYSGITYTRREKVLQVGPVQVEHVETHRVPIAPIVAGLALVGGAVLVLSKRSTS